MEIENQIPTLEQCRKLESLKIDLKTVWIWTSPPNVKDDSHFFLFENHLGRKDEDKWLNHIAPTTAELIDFLPASIKKGSTVYDLRIEKTENYCNVCYWCEELKNDDRLLVSINGTMVESLTEVLIWLTEKKGE